MRCSYIRLVPAAVVLLTVLAVNGNAQAIVPFKIQVPDSLLAELKRRLAQARFADEFQDAGWDYGTNLAYLKSIVEYWRDRYDWRAQEKRLNAFDQFKTSIDGRSEERRVGEEGRSRWAPYHLKKKKKEHET